MSAKTSALNHTLVEYHIILHPSYRVPTLYLLLPLMRGAAPTIEHLYHLLTSNSWRETIQSVGVMGGISQTVSMGL